MSSSPIRDQKNDDLITPENAALIIIDYQPVQIQSINSMSRPQLIANIVILAKLAKNYRLPVVLSTVNVKTGANKNLIGQLRDVFPGQEILDRTSINAWEDGEFRETVISAGRKKLIIAALWTEACLSFPALDALKEGFDVYAPVDAVGGTSTLAHETALRRMEQAGVQLTSIAQLACELQRDWNRKDTVKGFVETLQEAGIFLKLD
jgi:nicotinamidase-related amidase